MRKFRTKESSPSELPLECSPFFRARYEHLKAYPTLLEAYLSKGNMHLLRHLQATANMGEKAALRLMVEGASREEAAWAVLPDVAAPETQNPESTLEAEPLSQDLWERLEKFETWMEDQPLTFVT
jgi:hypothetical protein